MHQLSLKKCTKEACERCDMGYILKDFIKPIMQCVTLDIPSYHMRLLTTKCLNQAVLMTYFMVGNKAVDIADQCDTREVQNRHANLKTDNNTDIVDDLTRRILHPICKYRKLYYILITDAEFSHPDGNVRNFPGHVFILEKIPGNPLPSYYFHQSYINKYDYNGHIKKNNNSLQLSHQRVQQMMQQIRYVIMNPTWDENTVKYWKEITFVDTKKLLGAQSGGKMFLCFRRAKVSDCIGRLKAYVDKKIKHINKMKIKQMNDIYGDKSLYDSDQKPLTVMEMKIQLEKLQQTIENEIKSS